MAKKKRSESETTGIISIVIGIIILIWPQVLSLAIGIWLILFGALRLTKG